MKIETKSKLLTIYVKSDQQWQGRALYSAIVQHCQDKNMGGATVSRCVEGYGHDGRLHTTRLLSLSESLPVRIEIVDAAERIDALLADLDGMIDSGLVTVTDVQARRYLPAPENVRNA